MEGYKKLIDEVESLISILKVKIHELQIENQVLKSQIEDFIKKYKKSDEKK